MNPTKLALIAIGVLHLQLAVPAATPPPEKLLPADTLAVFTTPDCNKASAAWGTSPWSRLWNDESMRGFATKFEGKFRSTIVQPLEKQLGIKFADYAGFAQGQFTLAVTRNGWDGKPETKPGLLLILDAGNKSADLGKNLATLRQKWTDGGRSVRSTRIRDIEFTTVSISADEIGKMLEQAFPDADAGNENINNDKQDKKDEPAGDKMDITLGMSGSLLIASDTPKDIERVLVLQSGGSMPSLSEDPNFAATAAGFRDATSYAWLDAKTVVEVASAAAAEERPKARRGRRGNDPDISPDKLITTLGLRGLQSASLSSRQTSEGEFATLELRVPAAQRKGIFKLLTAETKDSGPPPFIPGDTVQLSRWRLDLSKFWPQIESMIGDVNPGAVAGIRAALDFVGKDKDPNFDLREQLFNNLGDDIVVAVKNPKERTLTDRKSVV